MQKLTLINGWTKERVLEQVKKRNNGKPAIINDHCRYRTPEGNCCVAGCFIPDELYDPGMEGNSVTTYTTNLFKFVEHCFPFSFKEMTTFQTHCHDGKSDNLTVYEAVEKFLNERVN